MKKRIFGMAIVLAALVLCLRAPVANAQLPTGPKTAFKTTFPVDSPPSEFQVVQNVTEFAPGAWTTPHIHGGAAYITVVQGELIYRSKGTDKTFKPGETWVEKPGDMMQVGNDTSSPARTLVTFLLPKGAALTTVQQVSGAQAPALQPKKIESKYASTSLPGPFDLIEVQQDFAPGVSTPVHMHGGAAYVTVMSGELTLRSNGEEKTYSSGESWQEKPGDYMQVVNKGTTPASTFVTFLLPKGAQLTTNQQQDAGANNSSSAPAASSSAAPAPQQAPSLNDTPSTPAWLFPALGLAAAVIVGGGALLFRRRSGQRW